MSLLWWIATALLATTVVALAFVVYECLTIYNIARHLKQYDINGGKKWIVKEIEGADRVKIGLKDSSGDTVAEADIECRGGHRLSVGDNGYL